MSEKRYLNPKTGAHPFQCDPRAPRPHIILVSVDMIPPESYDSAHPIREHLRTPNLDRFLAEGVRFSHAYSVSPLCGPSRAGYLTGRYPYLTVNEERAHDGWEASLRPSDAIFPEYLRAVGYATKHVGKCHVGAAKFLDAFGENDTPWDRWAPPLADDDGYLAHLRDLGVTPPVWRDPVTGLRPDRKTPGNNYGGFVVQADGSPFPEEATYCQYLVRLAEEKLDSALTQTRASLYLQLDFFEPHQPFLIPHEYADRARELAEHVVLPASYHEALSGERGTWPRVYDLYLRNWGLYHEETARRYMVMNFLQIEALDAALGRFLRALEERDLDEQAVVIFLGDHGEMNCERALIDKGVYGHPKVARVPLAVKLPGRSQARTPAPRGLTSLLDVAPTVFELTGLSPADRLDGESLLPVLRGEDAPPARELLFECGWHVGPNPAVSLLGDLAGRRLMYTYNLTSDRDELYDLDDPLYRDLARESDHADLKAEMIRRLGRTLQADPRWACYWHTFRLDRYEYLDLPEGDFQMFRPER
jgi:arylsulfatase A-like enzyme